MYVKMTEDQKLVIHSSKADLLFPLNFWTIRLHIFILLSRVKVDRTGNWRVFSWSRSSTDLKFQISNVKKPNKGSSRPTHLDRHIQYHGVPPSRKKKLFISQRRSRCVNIVLRKWISNEKTTIVILEAPRWNTDSVSSVDRRESLRLVLYSQFAKTTRRLARARIFVNPFEFEARGTQ